MKITVKLDNLNTEQMKFLSQLGLFMDEETWVSSCDPEEFEEAIDLLRGAYRRVRGVRNRPIRALMEDSHEGRKQAARWVAGVAQGSGRDENLTQYRASFTFGTRFSASLHALRFQGFSQKKLTHF